jgi:hypothetical protein
MEPPVGYGSMHRSIFPESRFRMDTHPSFLSPESRFRTFPAPLGSRFGSPPVLAEIIGCGETVVGISYVEWTPNGLLRHVVYLGEREDTSAVKVRRNSPPGV